MKTKEMLVPLKYDRVQTTFLSDFSLITPYIVKQKCKGIMVKKKVILTCIYSTCTTAAN